MRRSQHNTSFTGVLVVILLSTLSVTAYAGSVRDYGLLTLSPPESANYVTWTHNSTTNHTGEPAPREVLTEDAFNSGVGTNLGYQGGEWQMSQLNFTGQPGPGEQIYLHFGGLGTDLGDSWTYDFAYGNSDYETDHGITGAPFDGIPCPTMTQGSYDPVSGNKVINWQWSGPSGGTFLIYRSLNGSGAENGASNGRYAYVDRKTYASGTSGSYTDTTIPTSANGISWHIVIPADGPDGGVGGCHSEESNPTAVTLHSLSAAVQATNWLPFIGLSLPALASLVALLSTIRIRKGQNITEQV